MAHSDCRWTCGCAGKTVISLENTCHTWALLKWWFTKRRYIKCKYLFLYLYVTYGIVDDSFRRSHTLLSLVWHQNISVLVFWATVRYVAYLSQSCEHSDVLYVLLSHMTEDDISTMSELTYLAMKFQLQVVTSANCRWSSALKSSAMESVLVALCTTNTEGYNI